MLIATYILKVYSTVQRAAKSKPPILLARGGSFTHNDSAPESLLRDRLEYGRREWYCYKKPILIYPPRWSTEITNKLFDMTL